MQARDPVGELRRFSGKPPWVLAVSGGRDSMALLAAAQKLGRPFEVVTIDHGLRKAAKAETQLVLEYHPGAHVVRLKPPKNAGLAWAREARYAALRAIAGKRLILTAHHRDDYIETLLLGMLRGASPDSWASFSQPGVARPFLDLPRRDLEHFVNKHRVPFVDDPSNDDPRHPRALVRHRLIPLLHTLGPAGWEVRFVRLARDVSSDAQYLASLLPKTGKQLDIADLPEPLARRAAWRWLAALAGDVQRDHVDALLRLLTATSEARVKLPGGRIAARRGRKIVTLKSR